MTSGDGHRDYEDQKRIFLAALELKDVGKREAFLEAACAGDSPLRESIQALLQEYEEGGGFEATVLGNALSDTPHSASDNAATFVPGKVLMGRYRIVSLLGKGGMGEVYRADDLKLGQPVAMKFLPEALAHDRRLLEALYNEVRQARRVSHRHVCRVYDIGEAGRRQFLSMEFIAGEDLGSLLRRIGRLPGDKAIELALQLCLGLQAAHEAGLLHLDLKPRNLMIDERGVLRITDFGLARLTSDAEAEKHRAGTPAYMAPEQILQGEASERSDLYAVGQVLYEMMTGKRVHAGRSYEDILHWHQGDAAVEPPSSLVPNLDREVERIILHCLEKNPEDRPQSITVVLEKLAATASVEVLPRTEELANSDVYISFASIDDQPLSAEHNGWVSQFQHDLGLRLQKLSGEEVRVWKLNKTTLGHDKADQRVLELLPSVKILVSVISPSFVRATGCQQEVETFWKTAQISGNVRVGGTMRILKVVKAPVKMDELPAKMRRVFDDASAFEFYDIDPETGHLREYEESLGPRARQYYFQRLYELAHDVNLVLRSYRQGLATGDNQFTPSNGPGKTVFLAECTSDLRAERDRLKRELIERGYTVLPNRRLPMEQPELESVVRGWLAESDFALHPVGRRYGWIPDGENRSFVELQNQWAAERSREYGLRRLIWIPSADVAEDERQIQMVLSFQEQEPKRIGAEVFGGNINAFKNLILQRLDPPQPKARPIRTSEPYEKLPFPGLRPYHTGEGNLFFGRDAQTLQLLNRLRKSRFIAVVGTSGSGKSSLVRAGLIPGLLGGMMTEAGTSWAISLMRPGGRPVDNLARALVETALYHPEELDLEDRLKAMLDRSRLGLTEVKRFSDTDAKTNLLLVIDQFEEVFRFQAQKDRQDQASDFINLLLEAASQKEQPVYVVITMRSDFLGDCSRFPGLAEAVNDGEYLVPRMTWDQCREAIEGPVSVGGGVIAPRLVDRLLNDVGEETDQLPVLQHALMRMWENWGEGGAGKLNGSLDLVHYEAVGGMSEALSRHADDALEAYIRPARKKRLTIAKRFFQALTERASDSREIRRPQPLKTLRQISGADEEEIIALIEVFRKPGTTFLMPGTEEPLQPQTVIDISHESLMRVWQRLRVWVEEESQSARIYRRLRESAELHVKGRAGLYHNPDLQIAQTWRERNEPNHAWAEQYGGQFETAMEFLDLSDDAARQAAHEEAAARHRELWLTRVMALVVFIGLLLATSLGYWAWQEKTEAERLEREAARQTLEGRYNLAKVFEEKAGFVIREARQEHKFSEPELRKAWLYTISALSEDIGQGKALPVAKAQLRMPEPRGTTYRELWRTPIAPGAFGSVAFSPDGKLIAAGAGKHVQLWNAESGEEITLFSGHVEAVTSVAFSPNGAQVLSGSGDNTMRLWDLATQQGIAQFSGHREAVTSVAFQPEETQIISGSSDGTLRLWDIATHREIAQFSGNGEAVSSVAFSPRGNQAIAGSSDGTLRLWDIATEREIAQLSGHGVAVMSVAFSPGGAEALSGSTDGTLRLWDLTTQQEIGQFSGHSESVTSVAFSSDGRQVLSGSEDTTIRLWDITTQQRIAQFSGHRDQVMSVAFSPGGTQIMSGSKDGSLRLWDIASRKRIAQFSGHRGSVMSVAVNSSGTQALTGSWDGTLRLWDLATRQEAALFSGHNKTVRSVAFSPSGTQVLSGSDDGTLRLWDLATQQQVSEFSGHDEAVMSVAFDPSGSEVLSGSRDGTLRLWNLATQQQIAQFSGHRLAVMSVAFSPDGTQIISGSTDNTLILWEVATKQQLAQFSGHSFAVTTVAFSPDGSQVLSGSYDRTVRLWDIAAQQEITQFSGHTDTIWNVAFSPDGTQVLSGSRDGSLRLWDIAKQQEIVQFSGHGDTVWCAAFNPDGSQVLFGSWDGTLRVWDITRRKAVGLLTGHGSSVSSVAYRPGSAQVLSGSQDHTLRLWNLATQQEIGRFSGHRDEITSVSFSPNSPHVLSGSKDGALFLWDLATQQKLAQFPGHLEAVTSVAYHPIGTQVISGSEDGTLRLWSVATQQQLAQFSGYDSSVTSVAFSGSGNQALSGSEDNSLRLWDVVTHEELARFSGHSESVMSVAFSPSGTRALSGSLDRTMRLWDVTTQQEVARFSGHNDHVTSVAFSPNGTEVISGSNDGTLRVWDVATQQEIARYSNDGDQVKSVAFSPDGSQIISGSSDGTLHLWDLVAARFPVGEPDSERFKNIHEASLNIYPYKLEGFRLVDAPFKRNFISFNGYQFPKPPTDQKYRKLRSERPAGKDLVEWILQCAGEWE